jgi:hypothetical protein
MQASQEAPAELIAQLRSQDSREQSVLVFRGTGVNAWHYYPFLRHFSLQELSQFAAIYGVSGGAAIVWFYTLAQSGLFDEAAGLDFDRIIRKTMNERGPLARFARLARRQFPYSDEDVERFLAALPAGPAREHTLADVRLPNFAVVAHDKRNDGLVILDRRSHPQARVLDVLARAGTPSDAAPHAASAPAVSDFDFAGANVKRAFAQHLDRCHSGLRVFQVNMRRSGVDGRTVFVRACADRFPRWSQVMDLLLLFAGLPNPHYRATWARSGIGQPKAVGIR